MARKHQPQVKPGDPIKVDWGRFGEVSTVVNRISRNGRVYAHRARHGYQQTVNPQPIYWHSLGEYWSIHK